MDTFEGSKLDGIGFTMEAGRAGELIEKDARNADVLFPYLNGQDLNSRLDCSASRWVINFHDWSENRAKEYPECYEQVLRLVKPERQHHSERRAREFWWRFQRPRPELQAVIAGLSRVLVVPRVTKYLSFMFVRKGQVYDTRLVVFASQNSSLLCVLSSAIHQSWALAHGTTHETRPTYFPERCFETFPHPGPKTLMRDQMRDLGDRLDIFRRELMLARQAGLTATYNLVHDWNCTDADIAELREIHRAIDEVVVQTYGWDDLLAVGLDHGFHDTRQGPRYTIGATVRQEILDRLLELNHERYAAEVKAGLHNKRGRNGVVEDAEESTLF